MTVGQMMDVLRSKRYLALEPRDYELAEPLALDFDCEIRGHGYHYGTVLRAGGDFPVIRSTQPARLKLEGLTFLPKDPDAPAPGVPGVWIERAYLSVIRDCLASHFMGNGYHFAAQNPDGANALRFYNVQAYRCADAGLFLDGAMDFSIWGGDFEECGEGIRIREPAYLPEGVRVSAGLIQGVRVERNIGGADSGIVVESARGLEISGNYLYDGVTLQAGARSCWVRRNALQAAARLVDHGRGNTVEDNYRAGAREAERSWWQLWR